MEIQLPHSDGGDDADPAPDFEEEVDLSFLEDTVEKALGSLEDATLETTGDTAGPSNHDVNDSPGAVSETHGDATLIDYSDFDALVEQSTNAYVRGALADMSYNPPEALNGQSGIIPFVGPRC